MARSRIILPSVLVMLAAVSTSLGQPRDGKPPWRQWAEKVEVVKDVQYAKAGNVSLKLDIVLPKAESDKPRPVVVFIHGGAWRAGDKRGGVPRVLPLAATGRYVGVSVGYRLTGVATWPAQIHDCKAAIRFLRANAKKYNLDPDKIGVWGSSAGGHLVSMLGTSGDVKALEGELGSAGKSSRVTCVVDFCGPSDFLAWKDSPQVSRPGSPVYKLLGGPLPENLEAAKAASPVTHVTQDDPPFLIVHGTKDPVVPIAQAERLHTALNKAGVNSTFVKIEGGGHGIGGAAVHERVKSFFDKHLLGKDVEVSAEPIEK